MNNHRFKNILYGILFVLAAIILVLSRLHMLTIISVSLVGWLLGLIFLGSTVIGIIKKNIPQTVFSIAILLIIFAKPLHIQSLSPWTIFVAAALIVAGLSFIFPKHSKSISWNMEIGSDEDDDFQDEETDDNNNQYYTVDAVMTGTTRYIHSNDIKRINIDSKLADVKVFLEDCHLHDDEAVINLNVYLSDVDIYVPANWQIKSHVATLLADFSERDKQRKIVNGPVLNINGNANLCDVSIHRI